MSAVWEATLHKELDAKAAIVSSHNEWDPLEEVIVGVIDGAAVPPWDLELRSSMPEKAQDFFREYSGRRFPNELLEPARAELEGFVKVLEREGVTVRRPDSLDHARPFMTPFWWSATGLYAAMPRDSLLCIGNEIIEVPMAWRSRYHETSAYRSLLKEYFHRGAKWTAAPRPELRDDLYDHDWVDPEEGGPMRYPITEWEPTFDAADFFRCGRDIFGQKSNVTNDFGIEWLRRHLGDDYNVHVVDVNDSHPMHIDATMMPLAPGKLLVNPDRVSKVPEMFSGWDILVSPKPILRNTPELHMCSNWIAMNVFSLDEKRVFVETSEVPLVEAFKNWGFEPIPIKLRSFNTFGGGFHCCTLDVRRTGDLESYC